MISIIVFLQLPFANSGAFAWAVLAKPYALKSPKRLAAAIASAMHSVGVNSGHSSSAVCPNSPSGPLGPLDLGAPWA